MRPSLPHLRRPLAAVMALLWAWSMASAGLHALETQHVLCEEHGVLEELSSVQGDSADSPAQLTQADPRADGDAHGACAHSAAQRGTSLALPTATALPAPAPPLLVSERRPAPPVTRSEGPRGPPLLSFAAKTSPPRA